MNEIYDGGPANPFADSSGISIRDSFAIAIITGVYSAGAQETISVVDAYRKADEMLAVRSAPLPVIEKPVVAPIVPQMIVPIIQPVVETPVADVTDTTTQTT